jgi:hypothetical protein
MILSCQSEVLLGLKSLGILKGFLPKYLNKQLLQHSLSLKKVYGGKKVSEIQKKN